MKNDHSSIEEKHQFERRNMGQKRWSECLIYWWIRQMTRWCVMYTGECPSILARTYEWTLRFVWMLPVSAQIFSTGWCTSPHRICHECWLIASELFPSSENCHQLNRSHIARRSPECVWGSLQSMTDSWGIEKAAFLLRWDCIWYNACSTACYSV